MGKLVDFVSLSVVKTVSGMISIKSVLGHPAVLGCMEMVKVFKQKMTGWGGGGGAPWKMLPISPPMPGSATGCISSTPAPGRGLGAVTSALSPTPAAARQRPPPPTLSRSFSFWAWCRQCSLWDVWKVREKLWKVISALTVLPGGRPLSASRFALWQIESFWVVGLCRPAGDSNWLRGHGRSCEKGISVGGPFSRWAQRTQGGCGSTAGSQTHDGRGPEIIPSGRGTL